jgi:hypothetical protein
MYEFNGGIFYDPKQAIVTSAMVRMRSMLANWRKDFPRKKPVKGFWNPLRMKRVNLRTGGLRTARRPKPKSCGLDSGEPL